MKKRIRMVEVEEYVASNGRIFKTADACERYEDKLAAQTGCIIWGRDEILPCKESSIEYAEKVIFKDAVSFRWFNERSAHSYWTTINADPETLNYPVMFKYNVDNNKYTNWEDEKKRLLDKVAALDKVFADSVNMTPDVDINAVEPDYDDEEE